MHALAPERSPIRLRDSLGIVVEILTPIRPANIVYEHKRERLRQVLTPPFDQLKFTENGVPVVVAVDEHHIESINQRDSIQAANQLEGNMLTMALLPSGNIILR